MAEKIISLRPHHLYLFVGYYFKFQERSVNNPYLEEEYRKYGKEFFEKEEILYNDIASGGDEDYILIKNGLDSVCNLCPIKKDTCSEPDSLDLWNGSGYILQQLKLREGVLYTLNDFLKRVKTLYPYINPITPSNEQRSSKSLFNNS